MAQEQPETLEEFGQLVGVGQKKLDQYGETFLNALDEFLGARPAPEVLVASSDRELPINGHGLEEIEVAEKRKAVAVQARQAEKGDRDLDEEPIFEPHNFSLYPTYDPEAPKTETVERKQVSQVANTPIATPETPIQLSEFITLSSTQQETLQLHKQGMSVVEISETRQLKPKTILTHLSQLLAAGQDVDIDAIVTPERQRQIFRASVMESNQLSDSRTIGRVV